LISRSVAFLERGVPRGAGAAWRTICDAVWLVQLGEQCASIIFRHLSREGEDVEHVREPD
jgi:hypothetical protein